MKRQNKCIAFFLGLLLMSFSPVNTFAVEITEPTPLYTTSGLDLDQEVRETTFERSRLVYGEALPDSVVSVSIGRLNGLGEVVEEYQESLTVGSLGMFSLNLPLELGTNYITLSATAQGYESVSYEVRIKRYSQQVKKELQTMMALPGITVVRR